MFVFVYIFVYVYAFVYVYIYVSVIVYVFVHVFFFPNSEALGFQSLNKAVWFQFWPETAPGEKIIPMGVNKALDGKGRFLKPDYHYTTIFLAP